MPDALNEAFITVECPECRAKMQMKIGLTPPLGSGMLECPICRNKVIALVPGPILEGPFPATH